MSRQTDIQGRLAAALVDSRTSNCPLSALDGFSFAVSFSSVGRFSTAC